MPDTGLDHQSPANVSKFQDPDFTAKGEARAFVSLTRLRTLWFNTGSLCNITCDNCYIESSPRNDRLAYLSLADVRFYLDEIAHLHTSVEEIGFTGGEPFLNREFPEMLGEALARGYRALVLTNAMRPMQRRKPELLDLCSRHGPSLTIRISIDHFRPEKHEAVCGHGTWRPMLEGLRWLAAEGFRLHVAGRMLWNEPEAEVRAGYARLFRAERIPIDAHDPASLVLFPEMDLRREVPEITTRCWNILDVHPTQMMCAFSRMVIKRKGAERPVVVPCTLLPYDSQFELGQTLAAAKTTVKKSPVLCAVLHARQGFLLGGLIAGVPGSGAAVLDKPQNGAHVIVGAAAGGVRTHRPSGSDRHGKFHAEPVSIRRDDTRHHRDRTTLFPRGAVGS